MQCAVAGQSDYYGNPLYTRQTMSYNANGQMTAMARATDPYLFRLKAGL